MGEFVADARILIAAGVLADAIVYGCESSSRKKKAGREARFFVAAENRSADGDRDEQRRVLALHKERHRLARFRDELAQLFRALYRRAVDRQDDVALTQTSLGRCTRDVFDDHPAGVIAAR